MVDVIGRAKVIVTSQIDKSSLDQTGGRIGAGIKSGAVIGVTALAGLTVAGVKAYQAFEEAEAQSRKLNNVLENMGQGDAAPRVEKLADELMRLTGIDDEVIKGGQTILALFPDIAKSAGDVGGTFERTTKLSLDMAQIFGSVESASKTLGKALSDPEKATQLLRRANVKLTEEQQSLIDGFVAAGDEAAAQGVILEALEGRYAGTAEAAATESQKIASAWGEVQEATGLALAELTDGEVTSMSDALFALADAIEEVAESEGWEDFGDILTKTGKKLKGVTKDTSDTGNEFLEQADTIRDAWNGIPGVLEGWADDFEKGFFDPVKKDWKDFKSDVENVPKTLERRGRQFRSAGRTLLREFVGGLAEGVIPGGSGGAIAERIKDAINDALPNSITFFGRRGGIPAITVPIPQLATGTRNFRGGLAKVGEHGPEYVGLPAGSDVFNASHTQQIDAAGGGGNFTYAPQFYGPVSGADQLAELKWLSRFGARMGAPTSVVV